MSDKAMRTLESLTPMGSEYHNDPERCAAYVRDRFEQQHRVILEAKRREKEAMPKLIAVARTALKDAEDMLLDVQEDKAREIFQRKADAAREALRAAGVET